MFSADPLSAENIFSFVCAISTLRRTSACIMQMFCVSETGIKPDRSIYFASTAAFLSSDFLRFFAAKRTAIPPSAAAPPSVP